MNPPARRIEPQSSVLLIVDVQARLAPHVLGAQGVEQRCIAMAKAARALDVPVFLTEHCAEALGATLPSIVEAVPGSHVIRKRHFSAMDEAELPETLGKSARRQVLIAGMEAHVCVMQTTLGLLAAGYECWLAADAVGSRRAEDRQIAIERMRESGATVVSAEMALFEWLRHADHAAFRSVLKLVKDY